MQLLSIYNLATPLLSNLLIISLLAATHPSKLHAQALELEIWQIQGSGFHSDYEGQFVKTTGNWVTAVGNDRFFIQTSPSRSDLDPHTSDAIMVYTGTPPGVQPGDWISVTGFIQEYNGNTEFSADQLSVEVLTSSSPPAEVIMLDEQFPSPLPATIPDLESVEHMLVQVNGASATGPTSYGITPLSLQAQRPFREPGISFPGINGLPLWDGNPEVFELNTNIIPGTPSAPLSTGMKVTGAGVIVEDDGRYQWLPYEYTFVGEPVSKAVRSKNARELSIASLNTFVFNKNASDYPIRLAKLAHYIVHFMHAPDVLALQEVGSQEVLNELILAIQQIDPGLYYQPFIVDGISNFPIFTGFLVSNAFQKVALQQLGENQQLSFGGRLHDRPPLLLSAEIKTPTPTPILLLNIHLRSLNGIEGGNALYVRTKRHEQAVSVARMIQSRQGKNLIVLGDFNAFEFSDGYVDVVNQISGQPSLGAQIEVQPIVEPPMSKLSELLPPTERYSYVFNGHAQLLDHCLSSELEGLQVNDMQFVRGNADNPTTLQNDASTPLRASDHDGLVVYLGLADSLQLNLPSPPQGEPQLFCPNPFHSADQLQIGLAEAADVALRLFAMDGRLVWQQRAGIRSAGWHWLDLPDHLAAAIYILEIKTGNQYFRKKLLMGIE